MRSCMQGCGVEEVREKMGGRERGEEVGGRERVGLEGLLRRG